MSYLHSSQRKTMLELTWLSDFAISWNVNASFTKNWTASFPGVFWYILWEEKSRGKKLWNLKNALMLMFAETSPNKLLLLPKR